MLRCFLVADMRFVPVIALFLALATGCGPEADTVLGFRILRADELRPGSLTPRGGLDREHVVEATCQVLDTSLATVASRTVQLDPESDPGSQEVRLGDIPRGGEYFARLLGLDEHQEVYECGVTGPFVLAGGESRVVPIVIDTPPPGDPYCQAICASDDDCQQGAYCPSPCARGQDAEDCVYALCLPYQVGAPCSGTECGADLSCVMPGYGFTGGYCTTSCDTNDDCPDGTEWSSSCCPGSVAGLGHAVCTLDCTEDGDCREGYVCIQFGQGDMGCLPEGAG